MLLRLFDHKFRTLIVLGFTLTWSGLAVAQSEEKPVQSVEWRGSLTWVIDMEAKDVEKGEKLVSQVQQCIHKIAPENRVKVALRAPVLKKDEKKGSLKSFESSVHEFFSNGATAEHGEYFIYLKSHGCKDGLQRVSEDRRDLEVIPYEKLADIIFKAAARNTQKKTIEIYVSACYAGAFIPHIEEQTEKHGNTFTVRVWSSSSSDDLSQGTDFYDAILGITKMNRNFGGLDLGGKAGSFCTSDAGSFCTLSGGNPSHQFWTNKGNNKVKELSTSTLIKLLESPDEFQRSRAVLALGRRGKKSKSAVDKLAGIMADKNEKLEIRVFAAQAINDIGTISDKVLRDLVATAKDTANKGWLRRNAAITLGGAEEKAVPTLIDLINEMKGSEEVEPILIRRVSVQSLHRIGAEAKKAVSVLLGILSESGKDGDDDGNLMTLKNITVQALGKNRESSKICSPYTI